MWGWFRKTVDDPLLGNVQKGVIAALGTLEQRIVALAKRIEIVDENATGARAIETRLAKLDTHAHGTRALLEDHIARLDQSLNLLRGQINGGLRGTKRDRHAESIGAQIVEALGPDAAAQLAAEIAQRAQGGSLLNGEGQHDSAIGG